MSSDACTDTHPPLVSVIFLPSGACGNRAETEGDEPAQSFGRIELSDCSAVKSSLQGGADEGIFVDVSKVNGEYILFLEAGDRLEPDFLSEVQHALREKPDIVLMGSFRDEQRRNIRLPLKTPQWGNTVPLMEALRGMELSPCCKLIRRALLPECGTALGLLLHALVDGKNIHVHETPLICHSAPDAGDTVAFCRKMTDVVRFIREHVRSLSRDVRKNIAMQLFERLFEEACNPVLTRRGGAWRDLLVGLRAFRVMGVCGAGRMLKAYRHAVRSRKRRRREQLHLAHISEKVTTLRNKPTIRVLFLAISPACWKTDSLMKALLAHPRFDAAVLVVPEMQLTSGEERRIQMDATKHFMEERGYPVIVLCDENGMPGTQIPEKYDILAYPKLYTGIVPLKLDYPQYMDRLWLCIPYGFHGPTHAIFYDSLYQRHAWIECYENETCAAIARAHKQNVDNVLVSGLPFADLFLNPSNQSDSPWKTQSAGVKKVIWAPHWTINSSELLQLSCFLQISESMVELARRTIGRIQWAFKPHPLLYNALCQHPDWGKERADAYYSLWKEGENTQLETGDYVSLFVHSDAMVHDCCSFCCEYHLTEKPVLFLARDLTVHTKNLNAMAQEAVAVQYIGKDAADIERFIDETVLGGSDAMLGQRKAFRDKYLVPPHGRSAAENIVQYMLTGQR